MRSGSRRWMWGVAAAAANLLLLVALVWLLAPAMTMRGPAWVLLALSSLFAFADANGQRSPDVVRHPALPAATGVGVLALLLAALVSSGDSSTAAMVAGGVLMICGIALRARAMALLGAAFVTEVALPRPSPLVTHGLYRWVRHPSEAGILLVTLGAALLVSSSIALSLWPPLAALVWVRVRREDAELRRLHGPAHDRYAAQVGALWPHRKPG